MLAEKVENATRKRRGETRAADARIAGFTWLSDSVALARGCVPAPRVRMPRALLAGEGKPVPLHAVRVAVATPASEEGWFGDDAFLVLQRANGGRIRDRSGSLIIETSRGGATVEGFTESRLRSVEGFGSAYLRDLDEKTRQALFEQLLSALVTEAGQRELAAGLKTLRDAARPVLRSPELRPDVSCGMAVDGIWRIDSWSFYVEGWIRTTGAHVERLLAWTPEGRSVELQDAAFRYPRSDVAEFFGIAASEKVGFIAFVELPEPSILPVGWLLEARLSDGEALQVEMPPLVDDVQAARATILADFTLETPPGEELRAKHIKPALERIQLRLAEDVAIDVVDQLGNPPAEAEVSVVIPLYRRLEFLEHQLAEFVHDPEFQAVDLIYMLDSPADGPYLRGYAAHLHRLYGVPFRLAVSTRNGGYSEVNNLGASIARGRLLLLLNSDVLPASPGWLSRMARFYDSNPSIGALAPKLLYEDESIQHAGLYFDRPAGAHVWSNEHYFKGLSREFPPANVARSVSAVTGAALMIELDLFRQLGGLSGLYVRGDYEDSDLCLRVRQAGREVWYLPDVELYHLEGQSYPTAERVVTSEYNKWLHTFLWRETILSGIEES